LPVPFSPVIRTQPLVARRLGDLLLEAQDRLGAAEDLVGPQRLGAQALVLRGQPALVHRVLQREEQLLRRERLLDEVEGAEPRRAHRGLDRAVAAHHHHRQLGVVGAQLLEHRDPVAAGHGDVQQHDVEAAAVLAHRLERRLAVGGGDDLPALVGEQAGQRAADALLVVDDQDATHARCSAGRPDVPEGSRDSRGLTLLARRSRGLTRRSRPLAGGAGGLRQGPGAR
jgi:hypothetical protein